MRNSLDIVIEQFENQNLIKQFNDSKVSDIVNNYQQNQSQIMSIIEDCLNQLKLFAEYLNKEIMTEKFL